VGLTYKRAGVDHAGKVEAIGALLKQVRFARRGEGAPVGPSGGFAGFVRFGKWALAICTDSVGTKHLIARALGKFDTIGIDCVAMNVNDMVCHGAEPLAFVDYLAVPKPDPMLLSAIGVGLNKAAQEANVTLAGGETAVVPDLLKEFDLSGTAVGAVERDRIVDGRKARPGDVLIALASSGVHCNGFTLVRKCVEVQGLSYRRAVAGLSKRTLGLELLTPTRLYVRPVLELIEHVEPTGMANITGGGMRNLLRIRKGLGFDISDPPKVQPIFARLQEWGSVSDREMYQTFNMGLGYAVVVRPQDEGEALRVLRKHCPARVVGVATPGGKVRVEGVRAAVFDSY
jgi:phosphoribosylformylglycinamidine cyclo-ligase